MRMGEAIWLIQTLLGSTAVILLLVYVGMTLIVTEFLVKVKGIAGLVGLVCLVVYFYATAENLSLWMIGLFFIGLTMMVIDGKFVQDGTMAAIGIVLMLIGLVMPTNDLLLGTGVACALILGFLSSLLSFRFFPKRDIWEKLTLRDRFTRETGYSSMNETYASLVGKKGIALTDMRPSGTIQIDGKRYSAISNGSWVEKGSSVKVESVNGTRIMIGLAEET